MTYRALTSVAAIAVAAPLAANATSASFTVGFDVTVTIDAPGATFTISDADLSISPFEDGSGMLSFSTMPSPLAPPSSLSPPLTISGSGMASGSAGDPFGTANILGDAFLDLSIFNFTGSDIMGSISWDISVSTDASATDGPGFADALASAEIFLDAFTFVTDVDIVAEEVGAETDALLGPFGPDSDSSSGMASFTLIADPVEELFVSVGGSAEGLATVSPAPVPVPPAIALLATALGGLGALSRLRRA